MDTVVLITGGFDPMHSGHLKYISAAASRGHKLVVGVNSDEWLTRKKGQPFMPSSERLAIISSIRDVDLTITFNDDDGTAKDAIRQVLDVYPTHNVIFANGGDRTSANIPEMDITDPRLRFEFGVGGEDKANSSSWILTEWKTPKTIRSWGYYRNLHSDGPGVKVKELTVAPHAKLSMQRHDHRSEHWHVSTGVATVNVGDSPTDYDTLTLKVHDTLEIPVGKWHQLCNNTSEDVKIVEIQYGANCIEEDIERHGVALDYGRHITKEEVVVAANGNGTYWTSDY